ncbi:tetratricopeptide repeat protein [Geobacter sp. SVR]|uniref:tetratricopeptide repeat protein n=1 Tax=Geobacter sp. SVR TaxID=2495594 RepID=UPI00143EFC4F|nr:tetratricopeptide repeat protein [Geobacter sp. SVR]BCS53021.1 hypothetical protein GSVR_13290 [Geobacter sp. SVR]GCF84406.1 hypothetical protein GSbR_10060 [Geobacter sp. SVR]
MSSKKDKLIEEAQRLALRGQIDRAIRAYEEVIALDPAAVNQRQKLAELLVKAGRVEEARREFETIGNTYSASGFYLKAISVFKRLQVMFPDDVAITLNLAGINEKQGLVGNALAEYKRAYDHYEKASATAEALNILDRMQQVDKQNAGIKLKLAEAWYQAGERERSYEVFFRLAGQLQEQGDPAAVGRLDARVRQLFPDKTDFMLEVLAHQVSEGNGAGAINSLQALLRGNPLDKRVWELILAAYQKLNRQQYLKAACQHYLKLFPKELSARKWMLDCLVAEGDVDGALAFLERCESEFIVGSSVDFLVALYTGLDQIRPSDIRILKGLQRAHLASGDSDKASAIALAIASLSPVSEEERPGGQAVSRPGNDISQQQTGVHAGFSTTETCSAGKRSATDDSPETGSLTWEPCDAETGMEVEIEIELDENFDFDSLGPEPAPDLAPDIHWLDPVDEIFTTAIASRRSVKFGSILETSDAQTHYDLGVAFKEMGLYDEAISEFRQAAEDPVRRLDCFVLQGACLRHKGDAPNAEILLRSLLKPEAGPEATCLIKYELALACEAVGKSDEAGRLLADIDATNPGFRDTRLRPDMSGVDSLDFSDEDLRNFEIG